MQVPSCLAMMTKALPAGSAFCFAERKRRAVLLLLNMVLLPLLVILALPSAHVHSCTTSAGTYSVCVEKSVRTVPGM